jgi:hypothetical protein
MLTVAFYYLPSGRLVHRKKDATDWGVQPQVLVPLDETAEKKVMQELDQHERYLPPVAKGATTKPTATTTQAASSDVQLQRAVDTMIGMVVLQNAKTGGAAVQVGGPSRPAATIPPIPDSMNPTSKPATTRPATTAPVK